MKGKSIEKRPSGRERQAGLLGKALENGDIKIRLKKEKPAFTGFLFDDYFSGTTFTARMRLLLRGSGSTSNVTFWPSFSVLKPSHTMAEK